MTECLVSFAQQVEALDFHGLWLTDAFGRGSTTLDPLSAMGVLCAVTKKVELGTCVIQLPIRHPVEHAHRVRGQPARQVRRLQVRLDTDAGEQLRRRQAE